MLARRAGARQAREKVGFDGSQSIQALFAVFVSLTAGTVTKARPTRRRIRPWLFVREHCVFKLISVRRTTIAV